MSKQIIISEGKKSKKTKTNINEIVHKQVSKALSKNLELKYGTFFLSGAVDYSGSVSLIDTVSQGDTDTARDGDRIRLKRLWCHGHITNGDATNCFRTVVFRWRPATTPTVGQVFTTLGSVEAPLQHVPLWDVRQSVIILHDMYHVVSTYQPIKKFQFEIPLEWNVQFTAGSSTVQTDGVYVAVISDSAAATHPAINAHFWFSFTDA